MGFIKNNPSCVYLTSHSSFGYFESFKQKTTLREKARNIINKVENTDIGKLNKAIENLINSKKKL